MSLLFGLPDELCIEFVTEWLKYRDLRWLDTALCSNQWREQLLRFLPCCKGVCSMWVGIENLRWMNRRGIAVQELTLDSKAITGAEWLQALEPVWKNLRKLTLNDIDGATLFVSHINTCTYLEYLIFRYDNIDIFSLKGNVFKKLLRLELPGLYSEDSDPVPILKLIHEHCRLLRVFLFQFEPTDETNRLLLDIVRLNADLNSVAFHVKDDIIKELASLCSRKLISISLCGRVDFNTMVHVLQHFVKIHSVAIHRIVDGERLKSYVFLEKSKRRLSLSDGAQLLDGWREFVTLLPELRVISWSDDFNSHLNIGEAFSSSVECVIINGKEIDEEDLKMMLNKCSGLTEFIISNKKAINWPEVLPESNKIKRLVIGSPFEHLIHVLTACRYLNEVCFICRTIAHDLIPTLIATIRNYRHATTGQSIRISCDFYIGVRAYHLSYDGTQFSGNLWDEHEGPKRVLDVLEEWVDPMKGMEAEVEASKRSQQRHLH